MSLNSSPSAAKLARKWLDIVGWAGRMPARAVFGLLAITCCLVVSAVEPPVTAIAFTPKGDAVVTASQAGVQVFRWPDLQLVSTIKPTSLNLHDLTFSPNGKTLAVAGGMPSEEGLVELFTWPEGDRVATLRRHEDSALAVVWRDDQQLVSASLDHTIILWDKSTKAAVREFRGHSRGVATLCFMDDRKTLVSAGIDQNLRVWDVDSGALVRSLNNHKRRVHRVVLRPDNATLPMVSSVSDDQTIRFWQPTIGRMVRFARVSATPLDVAWDRDGTRAYVSCDDGHVRVIDPNTVQILQDIPALKGWAFCLATHPTDGTLAVGGSQGEVKRVVSSQ